MIRLRNVDLSSFELKATSYIGDITAAGQWPVFIAPHDCVVSKVELVSTQACPPDTLSASTTNGKAFVFVAGASGTIAGARGGTATAVNSDSVSANFPYAVGLTSNNSLTKGSVLILSWSAIASGAMSKVHACVYYKPLLHRNVK